VPRQGPSSPGLSGAPRDGVATPEPSSRRVPSGEPRRDRELVDGVVPGSLEAALAAFCEARGRRRAADARPIDRGPTARAARWNVEAVASVIPIGRVPARGGDRDAVTRPRSAPGAPVTGRRFGPQGAPADRDDAGTPAPRGVLRLVRRTGAPVRASPAAITPPAMPSRRPRPPPRVTASAGPAVLRTALLVLFAAAAVALVGGRARADDRDAHQRRSAGSRLQPVRFTRADSALQ
jgi:hypothetical protein